MRLIYVLVAALLVACAAPPKPPPLPAASSQAQWSGRLSIKVDAHTARQTPEQQTTAGFTLVGSADAGQLGLFTPLGGKAAEVTWGAGFATITDGKVGRNFPSLSAALFEVTGADIPIANLFDWLEGKQNKALEAAMGWEADLTRLEDGRLIAVRVQPLPRIELRVVLEK